MSFSYSILIKKKKKLLNKNQSYWGVCAFLSFLPVGKVAIKKEDLCNYTGKENWFTLQPVDSNSEVQVTIKLHA